MIFILLIQIEVKVCWEALVNNYQLPSKHRLLDYLYPIWIDSMAKNKTSNIGCLDRVTIIIKEEDTWVRS